MTETTGLDKNVAAGLCYILFWVSGVFFLFLEKEDKDVRFHAMQSVIVFGGLTMLKVALSISIVGIPLIQLLVLVGLGLWIFLMVKGFKGERYKLPFAGDLAEKWLSQTKI